MRRIIFWALLLSSIGLFAQTADTLDFPQPQFVNPIFDSFTRNYISTSAMGRGYTGVAVTGGVDNVLLNPASFAAEQGSVHIELLVKPPVDANFYHQTDRMTSIVPFGVVAAGGKIAPHITGALLYSMPKTIRMDDFSIEMNFGSYLMVRYPTFNLHQLTANAAWHSGNFNVGLNLHNQIYYLSDITFLRTFDRLRLGKYILRPQLGMLYTGDGFNAGLTVTPPQNTKWDLKYVQYDTQLPLNIVAGATLKQGKAQYTAEVDYENDHALSDQFSDRYTVRLGAETTIRRFSYRFGYQYHPEVWHGYFRLPVNTSATADTSLWWGSVMTTGYLTKNTQHLLSIGTSWHHRDANINLAFVMDVAGKKPVSEFSASIDLNFSAFKRKGFLYFD